MSGRLLFVCLRLLIPVVVLGVGGIAADAYFIERFDTTDTTYYAFLACVLVIWTTCFAPPAVFELAASQSRRLPVASKPFQPALRPRVFQVRAAYMATGGVFGMLILIAPMVAQTMGQTLRPVDRIVSLAMAFVLLLETFRAFRVSVTMKRDRLALTGRERCEVFYRDIRNVEIAYGGVRGPYVGVLTLSDGRHVEISGRLKDFELAMGLIHGAVFPETAS